MTTSTVFLGFGAYVGAFKGLRQIEWWASDPIKGGFNQQLLIPTDLDKSPLGVVNGVCSIGQIEVDDHISNQGLTRVGPRFPQGEMIGIIWLSETYYNSLPPPKKPPHNPTTDSKPYELRAVLYWNADNTPARRYIGFRGRIHGVAGTQIDLDVWPGGRGQVPNEVGKRVQIDRANIDAAESQISQAGDDGAIYIQDTTARDLQLMSPKRPEASGHDYY